MPTLPQDTDFGRRPSLKTGRVDQPTTAGVELADSVARAASTFQAVLAERQSKEDRLNYALARNEIQQLDLEERAKLADDKDWQTHDERYSEGFSNGRDEIGQRYNLSPHDRVIMDSETALIQAQGRVQVGAQARNLEIDEARGRYLEGKAKTKANIILADPGARNNLLLGQLDAIDAQVELGYMTEAEGAAEREEMTQDIALASLMAMAPDERYRVIKASLDKRRGYGGTKTNGKFDTGKGALTAEDIREGKGTGSIADFLHADTAAKMLEGAEREDKTNKQRSESQDVVNRAWALYPEDQGQRMKYIADNSSGSVQNLAEEDARQRNNDELNAKSQASEQAYEGYGAQMETGELSFKEIPAEDLVQMEMRHVDALRNRSNMLAQNRQHPAVTQYRDPGDGSMSMEEWNNMSDYGPGSKTDQNLDTPLFQNAFDEQDIRSLQKEQADLRAAENSPITTGGLTPRQQVNLTLNGMGFKVEDDKGDDKLNGIKARLEGELRRRIAAEQNSTSPPRAITPEQKNKILAEILTPYAFTDRDFFTSDFDLGEATPVWLMTGKQRDEAYIDLERANLDPSMGMNINGIDLTLEEILRKFATDAGIMDPSSDDLQRAAFAWVNRIGTTNAETNAEVLKRLRGE